MKILFRNTIIWNQVLFLMSSILLLHLCRSITLEASPFNMLTFKTSLLSYMLPLISIVISSFFILRVSKYSKILYLFTLWLICSLIVIILFESFSKIVLILLFFYSLSAYYNFQLFKEEIKESYYNSNFDNNGLFDPMLLKIPCTVIVANKSYSGHLTNWNDSGCFIYFSKPEKLSGRCEVLLQVSEKVFKNTGQIVASKKLNDGIGVKFYENKKSVYNWDNFHKIINDKGFTAELIK